MSRLATWMAPILLAFLCSGCDGMFIEACSLGCTTGEDEQVACTVISVGRNEDLIVDFSLPVDVSTLNSVTFRVENAATGALPPSIILLDPDDPNRVIFRPALMLSPQGELIFGFEEGATYKITIRGELQDAAPILASTTGELNMARLECLVQASGILDVVPGAPTVEVFVDVQLFDAEGNPTDILTDVPANGAVDVSRSSRITLVFDDLMDPLGLLDPLDGSSALVEVLVVDGGDPLAKTAGIPLPGTFAVAYDQTAATTRLSFTPVCIPGPGLSGRQIVVRFLAGIEDLAGNALVDPDPIMFTGEDGDCTRVDLVTANATGNDLTIFFKGPDTFDPVPVVLGGARITDGPASVWAHDVDGDTDLDVVSANRLGNDLTVFFQTSPGTFDAAPLVLGGPGITDDPVGLYVGDVDGDLDPDIVCTNVFGNDVTVFLQTGVGSYDPTPLLVGGAGTTDGPIAASVVDLDGNTRKDIVTANAGGDNLTVFFQIVPGVFVSPPLVLGDSTTTDGPVAVQVADLDGDLDLDVVCANSDGNSLAIFFQSAPGVFEQPLILGGTSTTSGPSGLHVADVDGDTYQDIVSANTDGNNITIFLQESPGVFGAVPLTLGGPTAPRAVTVLDVNEDGNLDVVSANFGGNDLTVFLQTSPRDFQTIPVRIGGTGITDGPVSIFAADIDGL